MFPYFVMMAIASSAESIAGKFLHKSRLIVCFFTLICLVSVIFLAAVRDPGVGTDTLVYGQYMFDSSQYLDLGSYLDYQVPRRGFLMSLGVYGVDVIFRNIVWQYAFIQLLTFLPFYYVARQTLNKDAWIAVLIYCSYFYSVSLNFMNHSIACSFCLLAWYLMSERRSLASLVTVAIAISFHITALIVAPILLYEHASRSAGGAKWIKRYKLVAVIFSAAFAIAMLVFLNNNLDSLADLKESYSYQVSHAGSQSRLPFAWVVWMIVLSLCFYWAWSRMQTQKYEDLVFQNLLFYYFVGIILYMSFLISPQLYRLALFYLFFVTIEVPKAIEFIPHGPERFIYSIVIVGATIFCCSYMLMSGAQGTYPYTSAFLGIQ